MQVFGFLAKLGKDLEKKKNYFACFAIVTGISHQSGDVFIRIRIEISFFLLLSFPHTAASTVTRLSSFTQKYDTESSTDRLKGCMKLADPKDNYFFYRTLLEVLFFFWFFGVRGFV
jgi:hypothetical protein